VQAELTSAALRDSYYKYTIYILSLILEYDKSVITVYRCPEGRNADNASTQWILLTQKQAAIEDGFHVVQLLQVSMLSSWNSSDVGPITNINVVLLSVTLVQE
jgi:hypothetical protein